MRLKVGTYNKLKLQANEAREQGMEKLAEAVDTAIGTSPQFEVSEYSSLDLDKDVHKDLWRIAAKVLAFHDLDSANIEQIDQSLSVWAEKIISDLEKTLQVTDSIRGPLEPKLPGEK